MSVHALALSTTHSFSKTPVPSLPLLANLGVQGDCHSGIRTTPPPTSSPYLINCLGN